jgi:hypothetical protein
MAAKTAFVLEGFNIRVSEDWVVEEMLILHEQHDITLFLFQDDDFPVFGAKWRLWARQFCDELHRVGLADRRVRQRGGAALVEQEDH